MTCNWPNVRWLLVLGLPAPHSQNWMKAHWNRKPRNMFLWKIGLVSHTKTVGIWHKKTWVHSKFWDSQRVKLFRDVSPFRGQHFAWWNVRRAPCNWRHLFAQRCPLRPGNRAQNHQEDSASLRQTWQWKIHHLWRIFLLDPLFSSGISQLSWSFLGPPSHRNFRCWTAPTCGFLKKCSLSWPTNCWSSLALIQFWANYGAHHLASQKQGPPKPNVGSSVASLKLQYFADIPHLHANQHSILHSGIQHVLDDFDRYMAMFQKLFHG